MSRYRGYGNTKGTRTYLSRREEFTMSDEEKHEAYLRRRKAEEAAAAAPKAPVSPSRLFAPMWPAPMDIMRFRAHGTPIPPPPAGLTGYIPEQYAAFANIAPCCPEDAGEEEAEAESPRP